MFSESYPHTKCFNPLIRPGQVKLKTIKLVLAAYSTKHTAVKSKDKNCLVVILIICQEWIDMSLSTCGLLCSWAFTIKIQNKHVGLVQSWHYHFHYHCNWFFVLSMVLLKYFSFGVKQQVFTHSTHLSLLHCIMITT